MAVISRRSRTSTIDDLFVTTYQKSQKTIQDQVFNPQNSALWAMLRAKGGLQEQVGGDFIKIDLEIGQNTNIQALAKGGTVVLQDFEFLDQARYAWKYYDIPIVRFWQDDQKNAGTAQVINMIQAKIRNTIRTYAELFETRLFASNSDSLEFDGLQNLVSDAGTGTVGEIVSGTHTWWQNNTVNFNDYLASGTGDTTAVDDTDWLVEGVGLMRTMLQDCLDKTDLIVTSQHMYNLMQDDMLSYFQWDGRLAADLGLPTRTPMFDGIPVTWSRKCGNRMYFLDMDSLAFYYDPRDFMTLGDWLPIANQPKDRVAHVTTVGSFLVKERRSQGVIYNLPS
jgi:hypothetical protein